MNARLAAALGLTLAACSPGCGGSSGSTPSRPSATPSPSAGPRPDVEALLAQMTLDEKIGQMTQAERGALRRESDIPDLFLGSVLSGGGSSPPDKTAPGWAEMYDRYQSLALRSRLGIPLVYGADAVHGHNNVVGAVIFPHNVGLGCTRNAALVERVARATAEEVAATGIDWTFAPCVAVARDERWGRTYESFGETPELVSEMAPAAVRGYQSAGILACPKHYLGDGGTAGGRDQGDTQLDEATLRAVHLPAYRTAIAAGAGSVMASFSSWNGRKMHGHGYLLTDVLKRELGFGGLVVSDWAGIDQLPGDYASDVEASINAGIDMVMVPERYPEFVSTLRSLVQSGRVPQSRVDDAVRRILRQKVALGLWERPYADRSLLPQVGSDAHRQVGRDAVRQSLVLLKNDGRVLPLSKMTRRIHVAGRNADDLGNQCGGWTITWQGGGGAITSGTTILQGIRAAVLGGASVTYAVDGSGAAGADVAVAVIGETPYAEGAGDRGDLALAPGDVAAVRAVKRAGVPVVVVLVSGRPLILDTILPDADAIVAAWLPGTEGAGVADVLFGDHAPSGKLGHSWPRSMSQLPINWGDARYEPLYAYGYGLTY